MKYPRPIYAIRDAMLDNKIIKYYYDRKRAEKYCERKSIYYWIEDRVVVEKFGDFYLVKIK